MKVVAYSIFLCFLILSLHNCEKEENYITDSNAKLEFSLDTLRFDTVFTSLGSATQSFKVYNRNDQPILISSISVAGTESTFFNLNIDGLPGNDQSDIEVLANDSIYVFSEVTIDPDQPLSVSPFIINDRILFETNGNTQIVELEAWGQNANYFPSRFNKGVPVVLSCGFNEVVWDDPKPYVIYGEVFIDSCTLNIPAGAEIYVHGGIARNDLFGVFNDGIIYVLQDGQLKVEGTKEEPVVIQGDRLELPFQEESGQWQGIIIGKGSKGNSFRYTSVKNAIFGMYVDSTADVSIQNSQIYNTSSSGIIGFHGAIRAENLLVHGNGGSAVLIIQGGDYDFTYCTIGSFGVDASALSMSNFFCYDDPLNCQVRADYRLNATFTNSIIFGSRRDEIVLSDISGGDSDPLFNVKFENCVVKVDELLEEREGLYADFLSNQCDPCINGTRDDALFVDPNGGDFHLDTLSIAESMAKVIDFPRLINIDLEGNPRDPDNPDIGCYERQE